MIEGLRKWFNDPHQVWAHRNGFSDFTRKRRFTFQSAVLLVLQKSAKSIQVHLNEFFCAWAPEHNAAPTASAWTQARAKLNASAFVAMNRQVVLEEFYQPDNPQQLWRGHRLLAIDGSEARLPESEELADYFGLIKPVNQKRTRGAPYILGRVTVLYDVLNRMVLEGVLSRYTVGEIQLGEQLLGNTRAGDVILCDRGFCGYGWLVTILQWGRDFICRVPRRSFGAAEALYKAGRAGVSLEVWLEPPPAQRARYRAMGYPLRVRVRLVTLRLPTGELEVLVTSLLSKRKYPLKALAQAYGLRWGVETFYGLVKGRLSLENFTGRTVESVFQDFYATLLIANLESVLCRQAQEELQAKRPRGGLPVAVNRAVSVNALKHQVIDLLCRRDLPAEGVIEKLRELFKANPVRQRPGRKAPRVFVNARRSLNFARFKRKMVF